MNMLELCICFLVLASMLPHLVGVSEVPEAREVEFLILNGLKVQAWLKRNDSSNGIKNLNKQRV